MEGGFDAGDEVALAAVFLDGVMNPGGHQVRCLRKERSVLHQVFNAVARTDARESRGCLVDIENLVGPTRRGDF